MFDWKYGHNFQGSRPSTPVCVVGSKFPGTPTKRAALLCAVGQPPLNALQVKGVATGAPHDWAVVTGCLAVGGAPIIAVTKALWGWCMQHRRYCQPDSADTADVVACVPCPSCYGVPVLNVDLERGYFRHGYSRRRYRSVWVVMYYLQTIEPDDQQIIPACTRVASPFTAMVGACKMHGV